MWSVSGFFLIDAPPPSLTSSLINASTLGRWARFDVIAIAAGPRRVSSPTMCETSRFRLVAAGTASALPDNSPASSSSSLGPEIFNITPPPAPQRLPHSFHNRHTHLDTVCVVTPRP